MGIFLTAYRELEYDMPVGMAVGLIPWSSIARWGALHGFSDAEDIAELVTYIRAIENTVRDIEAEKSKPKERGAKA